MAKSEKCVTGVIARISGPAVIARSMRGAGMNEVVRIGHAGLMGEIIRLDGDNAFIQSYEEMSGVSVGQPVVGTGKPLLITLGPGLLGSVFDGVQRPLKALQDKSGDFIERGINADALDGERRWPFKATVQAGCEVSPGSIIGCVQETDSFIHHVMVPPGTEGTIARIETGLFSVHEPVAWLEDGTEIRMAQHWPAKIPRPVLRKCDSDEPFITGQRILDCLFPIALGGVAALPGGFGTGKTVLEQSLAKFSAADVIVYVGCGERGNEMADVLTEFPELDDPRTGGPLMDSTVLVVNTSNMPVAAREASVYAGATIAEYFRDMGYNVAVMVDSTSRWAEAMREISSRLEEMPGEEGYPTYLASRLASFYERAGRVECLGEPGRGGSVTIVGAVSPPGGDFSEPVTQSTLRVAGGLWALDSTLAHRRHYPSVNWHSSYTLYFESLAPWFQRQLGPGWSRLRGQFMEVLQKDAELQEVVQLVGPDALQPGDRLILDTSRMFREGFLQQNAMSPVDATCSLAKQYGMLELMLDLYDKSCESLQQNRDLDEILAMPIREEVARLQDVPQEQFDTFRGELGKQLDEAFQQLSARRRSVASRDTIMRKDYTGVTRISGPLLFLRNASDLPYGAMLDITAPSGEHLTGQVIEVSEQFAAVQVFERTLGLDVASTSVSLIDREAKLAVSEDMIGRIFNGSGKPIDGDEAVVPEALIPVAGMPINPASRDRPRDFIQTGISAIDGFNTLVRGQKLPIFSGAGLPAKEIAAQILRQAKVVGEDTRFVIVFATIGITQREASYFMAEFERTGVRDRTVTFFNLADDPTIERILTPRCALTAAEYLGFELGYEVLVLMSDMTNYCEALREIATAREEIPGRRGYPGYMYTDLAMLYERAGRIRGRKGSVTMLPILTMPDDDITHPIPDLSGYITEGQIVLSRQLHRRGIDPPIDVLRSLSRLMNNGIGPEHTREDHRDLANQLYACYAQGQDIRRLVAIVGEEALSDLDQKYLRFAEAFEEKIINQQGSERTIEETLDIGWQVLSLIPKAELRRINKDLISRYFSEHLEDGVKTPFY